MSSMNHPHLSIVVTSRNDNHGGDMVKRMKYFLQTLYALAPRQKMGLEVVFVEWNPPSSRPLLKEALPLPPKNLDHFELRYVVVPSSLHGTLDNSDKLSMFQMIAKNVGVQRAKGQFVLCTNVDVIFSEALFDRLFSGILQKNRLYRANRVDVPKDIPGDLSHSELLAFCESNEIQRMGKNALYPEISDTTPWYFSFPFFGWFLSLPKKCSRFLGRESISSRYARMDTDACGDFTLMHKDHWMSIRGYIELEAYSIHIDSLLLYYALALEIEQHIFASKACIYHISHSSGWELQDPKEKLFWDIRQPKLDWSTADRFGRHIVEHELQYVNNEDWGLADHDLEEYTY